MFSTPPKQIFNFSLTFILLSASAFNSGQPKFLPFGKGLIGFSQQEVVLPSNLQNLDGKG